MDPAKAPLVGMQGPHRCTEAAQLARLHSVAVPSRDQTLSTYLHHVFFCFFTMVINMDDKMFLFNRLTLFLNGREGALSVLLDP